MARDTLLPSSESWLPATEHARGSTHLEFDRRSAGWKPAAGPAAAVACTPIVGRSAVALHATHHGKLRSRGICTLATATASTQRQHLVLPLARAATKSCSDVVRRYSRANSVRGSTGNLVPSTRSPCGRAAGDMHSGLRPYLNATGPRMSSRTAASTSCPPGRSCLASSRPAAVSTASTRPHS